mgnify:CR=1 FL=1
MRVGIRIGLVGRVAHALRQPGQLQLLPRHDTRGPAQTLRGAVKPLVAQIDLALHAVIQALRQQLLNQANSLATRFNSMNDFISSQKNSITTQRGAMVDQINTLSGGIADYNKKIVEMEATGGTIHEVDLDD